MKKLELRNDKIISNASISVKYNSILKILMSVLGFAQNAHLPQ